MKKCYYEVLGVERNATDDDIRKAFRKLALQLHPDKNLDRSEEAKAEFQILQQAYGVLSNPQERAWYDEHRQAVLREGVDADFDDFNIDLMKYCTSSCFSGYHDDENGFYVVYRDLFEKLTQEELDSGWADEHDDDIPNFGDSQSSYDEVVGPFYAFWESFCTLKSFGWVDEYDTRHAGNRRVARLMDKENKKIRSEARKAWNREVRALIDFVKRKDKRVQAWKVTQEVKLKEKQEALAKKAEEAKARHRAERKKILESAKKSISHPENQQELKEMEQWMSNEFGEQVSGNDSADEDLTCLHCAACNKSFKSERAFLNHEKSKKHLAQVQKLREMLLAEDAMFEEVLSEKSSDTEEQNGTDNEANEQDTDDETEKHATDDNEAEQHDTDDEAEPSAEDFQDSKIEGDLENATSQLENLTVENNYESEDSDREVDESEENDKSGESLEQEFLARVSNRNKKGSRRRQISIDDSATTPVSKSDDENPVMNLNSSDDEKQNKEKLEKKKKKKGKKQGAKSIPTASVYENAQDSKEQLESSSTNISTKCVVCKQTFSSRTHLFRHIKSSGHAAPLETIKNIKEATASKETTKGRKKKGKNRE